MLYTNTFVKFFVCKKFCSLNSVSLICGLFGDLNFPGVMKDSSERNPFPSFITSFIYNTAHVCPPSDPLWPPLPIFSLLRSWSCCNPARPRITSSVLRASLTLTSVSAEQTQSWWLGWFLERPVSGLFPEREEVAVTWIWPWKLSQGNTERQTREGKEKDSRCWRREMWKRKAYKIVHYRVSSTDTI